MLSSIIEYLYNVAYMFPIESGTKGPEFVTFTSNLITPTEMPINTTPTDAPTSAKEPVKVWVSSQTKANLATFGCQLLVTIAVVGIAIYFGFSASNSCDPGL